MTAPERRSGPRYRGRTVEKTLATYTIEGLHRRVDAAHRLPPLDHGLGVGLHRHDPLAVERVRRPQTFGLTPVELRTYARQLLDAGWTAGEIATVLDLSAVAA
jgi:hypothetical protein